MGISTFGCGGGKAALEFLLIGEAPPPPSMGPLTIVLKELH